MICHVLCSKFNNFPFLYDLKAIFVEMHAYGMKMQYDLINLNRLKKNIKVKSETIRFPRICSRCIIQHFSMHEKIKDISFYASLPQNVKKTNLVFFRCRTKLFWCIIMHLKKRKP